jgi:hypothetical protein
MISLNLSMSSWRILMNNTPILSVNLLRPYFKNMHYHDEKYTIDIELFSDTDQIAFEVSIECKEPTYSSSFPQRRFSLERHIDDGHEGVHIQINYHLVDNDMKIGRLYITLEINEDEELLKISEGFVYTLYEIINGINSDFEKITNEIFNTSLFSKIKDNKDLLIDKINESLLNQQILIKSIDRDELKILEGKDFLQLITKRKELIPLLGPLVELNSK